MGLKKILHNVLTVEELDLLVRGFDIVGDIAIIIIPKELEAKENLIADAVLASNKRIQSVAKRAGVYGGEYRTLPLKNIGGENRFETIHKENGVRLKVDLEKVYFSTRSGNERKRLSSLVEADERVLVMFSGIGPFPLMISLHSEARHIVGIEKNPEAHLHALANLKLNKRCKNISFYGGDVQTILPEIGGEFDRICMPLPKKGEEFIPLALEYLARPGWLHFYDFQEKCNYDLAEEKVKKACVTSGRHVVTTTLVECGHTAPRVQRVCVDAEIK